MRKRVVVGLTALLGANAAWGQSWVAGPLRPETASEMGAAILPTGELWTAGGEGAASVGENAYVLDPSSGAWRQVTELNLGRAHPSATVLLSGDVLVVGGAVLPTPLSAERVSTAAVELYDPRSFVSTTIAPMPVARDEHTATLLLDGRVFVVGGRTRALVGATAADTVLASSAIFDPTSRTWTPGPNLGTARRSHIATRLFDGRVLIMLGRSQSGANVIEVEIFNPSTGMISMAAPSFSGLSDGAGPLRNDQTVRIARSNGAIRGYDTATLMTQFPPGLDHFAGNPGAALLLDDGIVFAGGVLSGNPVGAALLTAADTLAPISGTFTARRDGTVARLPSGEVIVVGGRGAAGTPMADTGVYLPASPLALESLSTPPMPRASALHRATLLADGRILVVGGDAVLYAIFDRMSAVWSAPPLPTGITQAPAVATLAGGKVLAVGGVVTSASSGAMSFDPATTSWTTLPPMSVPRLGHTATRLDTGEILVAGGGPQIGEIYDPETESWRATAPLVARREGHTATRLLDGRVLLAGGSSTMVALATAEVYTPSTGAWSAVGPMAEPRVGHSAVLLPSGEVMVAGGARGGIEVATVEIWSPVTGMWRAGPAMNAGRTGAVMQLMADESVVIVGGLGPGGARTQTAERLGGMRSRWALVASPANFGRGIGLAGVLEPDGRYWTAGGYSASGATITARDLVERAALTSASRPISITVPALGSPNAPLSLTGTNLIAPTEGHNGRSAAVASDHPIARLFTSEGAFVQRLDPRALTATSLTADVGSVPPGIYMAIVTTAGRSAGGLVRIGNRLPVARSGAVTTAEDTPIGVSLSGGDRDGDTLSFTVTQPPTRGTLSGTPPSLTYTPAADAFGTDSFRFQTHDGIAGGVEATVAITVSPVNDPPRGADDSYLTTEDIPLVIPAATGLLANDTDVDSTTLTVVPTSIRGPANGTLMVQPDGGFAYAPATDFAGTDSFTYHVSDGSAESDDTTVTITVTAVNDAPEARDDQYALDEDQIVLVSERQGVLVNDVDVDSAVLTATVTRMPPRGILVLSPGGAITYTPEPDDFGNVTFNYRVSDGALLSRTATVTLEIRGVNDAPEAVADEYLVPDDGTLDVGAASGVLANDTDVDREPLSARLTRDVEHGALVLRADGSFRYVADAGYEGDDTFQYEARDRITGSRPTNVRLRVRPERPEAIADRYDAEEDVPRVVDAASGVLANDVGASLQAELVRGPTSGTLELRPDGSFTLTPAADFAGDLTFTYRARDGILSSDPATVTVVFAPINDPPPIPRPLVPADGTTLTDGAVSFGWQSVRDVEGGVVLYRIHISGASGAATTLQTADAFIVLSGDQLLADGRYHWAVEAVDAEGATSGLSPELEFQVASGSGPDGGANPDESGCGCASTRPASGLEACLLLALMAVLRRRSLR